MYVAAYLSHIDAEQKLTLYINYTSVKNKQKEFQVLSHPSILTTLYSHSVISKPETLP